MNHMSEMISGTGDHTNRMGQTENPILSCQKSPMQQASPQISCERATLFEGVQEEKSHSASPGAH